MAAVLFGDCNPSGRLPVTFYRSTADLPPFESYAMANRTYRFFTGQPLYAFGHGLSYTQFRYGPVQLGQGEVRPDGTIRVSTEITNAGGRDGDEVVQVYAHRIGEANPALPRQRLCAFQRVTVPKGQSVRADLAIPAVALRRWDTQTKTYVVDPGDYELRVGAASDDIRGTATVRIAPGV